MQSYINSRYESYIRRGGALFTTVWLGQREEAHAMPEHKIYWQRLHASWWYRGRRAHSSKKLQYVGEYKKEYFVTRFKIVKTRKNDLSKNKSSIDWKNKAATQKISSSAEESVSIKNIIWGAESTKSKNNNLKWEYHYRLLPAESADSKWRTEQRLVQRWRLQTRWRMLRQIHAEPVGKSFRGKSMELLQLKWL